MQEIWGSIPGSGRSHGEGNGNPLRYSCLENPMDRGDWRATVHRVTKNQTLLKQLSTHMRHIYDFKIFNSINHMQGKTSLPLPLSSQAVSLYLFTEAITPTFTSYILSKIHMIIIVGNTSLGCTMYRDVPCDSLI